ncbi:MAG: hypothetical protein K0V04_13675 [Deltaproteobacteria bacterium]|nr:hypothetical protein [Deltaproteobacteria bacterium]
MGIAAGTSIAAWIVRGSLHLTWPEAFGVAGFMAAIFVGVSWLPVTRGRINTIAHIAITFHLLVLSRIFFRSPDLDTAREMVSGLIALDGYGIGRRAREPLGRSGAALWPRLPLHPQRPGPRARVPSVPEAARVRGRSALRRVGLWADAPDAGQPRAFIYFQFWRIRPRLRALAVRRMIGPAA